MNQCRCLQRIEKRLFHIHVQLFTSPRSASHVLRRETKISRTSRNAIQSDKQKQHEIFFWGGGGHNSCDEHFELTDLNVTKICPNLLL